MGPSKLTSATSPSAIARLPSKKEQIATLYQLGISNIVELARLTNTKPSYVAHILQHARVLRGYFDLYTSTQQPMNVYSPLFAQRLGFKTTAAAHRSVRYLDALYQQFGRINDRAGQHHALFLALTMRNRAAWSGKSKPAAVYADWLIKQLSTP